MATVSAVSADNKKYEIIYGETDNVIVSESAMKIKNDVNIAISGKNVIPSNFTCSQEGTITGVPTFGCSVYNTPITTITARADRPGMVNSQNIPLQGKPCFDTKISAECVGGFITNFGKVYEMSFNIPVIGSANNGNVSFFANGTNLCKLSNFQNKPRLIGVMGLKGSSLGLDATYYYDRTNTYGLEAANQPINFTNVGDWAGTDCTWVHPISILAKYNDTGLWLVYNGPDIKAAKLKTTPNASLYWSTRLLVQATWIED